MFVRHNKKINEVCLLILFFFSENTLILLHKGLIVIHSCKIVLLKFKSSREEKSAEKGEFKIATINTILLNFLFLFLYLLLSPTNMAYKHVTIMNKCQI